MRKLLRSAISWYHSSLLPQFVSLAVVTSILFVLVAQLVTSSYFDTSLRQAIDAVKGDTILMQAQNLENQLHSYINDVYRIVVDRNVYQAALTLWKGTIDERAANRLTLRKLLSDYAINNIACITAVLPDRQVVFYSRLYGTWVDLPWFGSQINTAGSNDELFALYDVTMSKQEITPWFRPAFYEPTGVYLMHLAYPLIDLYTRNKIGMLVVTFNTATLRSMVNATQNKGEFFGLSYNVLTAQDGTIIAHPDAAQIGKTLSLTVTPEDQQQDGFAYITPDDYVSSEPVGRLKLMLHSITDKGITARQARVYTSRLLLAIGLVTLLHLMIFYAMMRRMMRSVRALQNGLETLQGGQLDVYVQTRHQHEVAQSIHAFNAMALRLKLAEARSRKHAERTIAALERQRIAEIKTLENQINSHFLYNTLNSINYTAIRNGNLDVSRQIKHLAHVLRYTFEKSDGTVTVLQEARWLEEYLKLQKLRFGNTFDYTVHVASAVEEWPMRKLIIQPFVENSVLHGFEGYTYRRMLTIDFSPFGQDRLRVTVRDNGSGIPPAKLKRIQESIQCWGASGTADGIGLENACQRIRSYYGKSARIYLRSWVGVGTTVVLLLPYYQQKPEPAR